MKREIVRSRNFAGDAARWIDARARQALAARGFFRLALSGGKTPQPIFRELAGCSWPWDSTLITFSDERCVPPTSAESNYHSAKESFLEPGNVPAASVWRLRGELEPETAASEYEEKLSSFARVRNETRFEHDLILLGLGDDGHTASLFPGTDALHEEKRGVVANYVSKLSAMRLTFTLPMIFAAREVCFFVGANKEPQLLERVFAHDEALPAAVVDRGARHVTWFIDDSK